MIFNYLLSDFFIVLVICFFRRNKPQKLWFSCQRIKLILHFIVGCIFCNDVILTITQLTIGKCVFEERLLVVGLLFFSGLFGLMGEEVHEERARGGLGMFGFEGICLIIWRRCMGFCKRKYI